MNEIDPGVRCEDHVGEVFPPRCSRCEALRDGEHVAVTATRSRAWARRWLEVSRAVNALLAGAITDPDIAPHVRLGSYLPADDLEAAHFTQSVVDKLVGMAAGGLVAAAGGDGALATIREMAISIEETALRADEADGLL